MARPLRIEYPGAHYYVINRGIAGMKIFQDDHDKEKFLEYLGTAAQRSAISVHSYCLMPNHFHLLIETPEAGLSRAIQWLNISYATYFNKKYRRSGHLFQGRFKAILVEADAYLLELSWYIHLNPVRANIVAAPGDYRWSSFPAFMGDQKKPDWLDTGLPASFGKNSKAAAKGYASFVDEVDAGSLKNPGKEVIGGCILGSADFASWVKENFLSDRKEEKEIPQLTNLKPRVSPERIVEAVCAETASSPERILAKGKKGNPAREIAIFLARDVSGVSTKELGAYFGGISGAGVTMRYNLFSEKLTEDKALKALVGRIRKRIFSL